MSGWGGAEAGALTMLQRHAGKICRQEWRHGTSGDARHGARATLYAFGGFGDPVLVSLRFPLLTPVSLCSPLPTPVRLRGLSVLRFAGQARSLTEATKGRLACGSSLAKVAETVYCAPLTQSLGIGGSGVGAQADAALVSPQTCDWGDFA